MTSEFVQGRNKSIFVFIANRQIVFRKYGMIFHFKQLKNFQRRKHKKWCLISITDNVQAKKVYGDFFLLSFRFVWCVLQPARSWRKGKQINASACIFFLRVNANEGILSEFVLSQDILYIGDHIFGDILKSKKKQGWRWDMNGKAISFNNGGTETVLYYNSTSVTL